MAGLVEMYAAVARAGPVPTPVAEARAIDRIRAWDERIVAPRHGFASAVDYYARASVGPRLHEIELPCLIVHGDADPMVPAATVEPALRRTSETTEVRWVRGGHVGFPMHIDLGAPGPRGLEAQVIAWLRTCRAAAP
jgi:predicted alpha/beta-fold hydrolase